MNSLKKLLVSISILITVTIACSGNCSNINEPIKFIVTGGPSSGKTTTLLYLEAFYDEAFIPESAAGIQMIFKAQGNDQPWNDPTLNTKILNLQAKRIQNIASNPKGRILLDRSPIDILAYEKNPTDELTSYIEQMAKDPTFAKIVFVIKHLGHVEKTIFRNEDLSEALRLEEIQIANYSDYDFQIVYIPSDTVENRAQMMIDAMDQYMNYKSEL